MSNHKTESVNENVFFTASTIVEDNIIDVMKNKEAYSPQVTNYYG